MIGAANHNSLGFEYVVPSFYPDQTNWSTNRTAQSLTNNSVTVATDPTAPLGDQVLDMSSGNFYFENFADELLPSRLQAPWTVEFYFKPVDFLARQGLWGTWQPGQGNHGNGGIAIWDSARFFTFTEGTGTGDRWQILPALSPGVLLSANQWYHAAFVRDTSPDDVRFYLDGQHLTYGVDATISWDQQLEARNRFGAQWSGSIDNFTGMMQEIRISSIARYSGSSFTPPLQFTISDTTTSLLVHGKDGVVDDNLQP